MEALGAEGVKDVERGDLHLTALQSKQFGERSSQFYAKVMKINLGVSFSFQQAKNEHFYESNSALDQ